MNKKHLTALAMAVMLGVSAVQPVWAAEWQNGNPLIAHALGEANGKIETNSKEAFVASWGEGFRVVEGDFTYTSDGVLVLRHDFQADGSYYRLEIRPEGNLVMDSQTYKQEKAVYEQTPITAAELLCLMYEYPDMYLVTDTKETDKATVQRQFRDLKNIAINMEMPEVLDRIIPQIYHKDMLGWVKEIHPFQDWIFTLYLIADPNYADIAAFCEANGIDTVTIHYNRATKSVVDTLKAKGLKVYAHTVNRYLMFEDLLKIGVDGIYTDRIKPYELGWVGLQNGREIEEQTIAVGEKELTLSTMDIFGKTYAPLRQLAQVGKKCNAVYDREANTLSLDIGKTFTMLGNEMLMDNSGRLMTRKADFKVFVEGQETELQCFYVDGEVYAPVEELLAFLVST